MKSKLKLEKILMVLFLFCTLNAQNLPDFNSQKYVRKSISYVPFLLQKESYNIKEENVSFILDALRNSVEMKKTDISISTPSGLGALFLVLRSTGYIPTGRDYSYSTLVPQGPPRGRVFSDNYKKGG